MWEDQKNSYKKFSLDLNLDLDSDLDLEKITLDEQNKDEKENLSDSIRVCQICQKMNIQKLPSEILILDYGDYQKRAPINLKHGPV